MSVGAWSQLRALLALRWQMIRTPGVRLAVVLVALAVLGLLVMAAGSADAYTPEALATAIELAPQAFLGFGVLALIAPLTAGGGTELMPPDQLVAYPVRPRTQFVGGLVLAPANLVWVLQIFAIVAETAYLTEGGRSWLGAVTSAAFVAALTATGQGLAWAVAGLRQTRRGRQSVAFTGAVLLLGALVLVKSGTGVALLTHSPTRTVVSGVVAGGEGAWLRWSLTTAGLLLLLVVALFVGERACAWALRRPGDAGASRESRDVTRRRPHPSALRTLIAVDRASVWRAPALRRGALVLALLPGLIAAGAEVPWESLIVLPGLVAAGAGLLFGVNAFCLDASGAVWVASLPHEPRLVARAKAVVLTETVFAAVVIAALAGSLRSPGDPTAAELVGIVASGVACTFVVVAGCMAMSVRRPHKAELKGPRDAVAPPGALAMASARLAIPAGFVGLFLAGATRSGVWWAPLAMALPIVAFSVLSLRQSFRRWGDPLVRSRIVQVVSAG